MKLAVVNESPTHNVTARTRLPGQPRQDETLAPGETRTFALPGTDGVSLSFLPGSAAETPIRLQAPAPALAPAARAEPTPSVDLNALPWPELRKRAIAAGAPTSVSKADALKLLSNPAA
jgi:hypothetical protein